MPIALAKMCVQMAYPLLNCHGFLFVEKRDINQPRRGEPLTTRRDDSGADGFR
jgi:hypothetical protein